MPIDSSNIRDPKKYFFAGGAYLVTEISSIKAFQEKCLQRITFDRAHF